MPKCQFLFSAVFGFRNPTQEIFSELDETKAQGLIFHGAFQRTEGDTKWGHDMRTARDRWEPQVEGVMRTAVSFPQLETKVYRTSRSQEAR